MSEGVKDLKHKDRSTQMAEVLRLLRPIHAAWTDATRSSCNG